MVREVGGRKDGGKNAEVCRSTKNKVRGEEELSLSCVGLSILTFCLFGFSVTRAFLRLPGQETVLRWFLVFDMHCATLGGGQGSSKSGALLPY
jgi:hypothetical protein